MIFKLPGIFLAVTIKNYYLYFESKVKRSNNMALFINYGEGAFVYCLKYDAFGGINFSIICS